MRWNPDLLGVVAPFVKLEDIGRFAVASRDIDEALRQPDERAAVLAHLGTAEVRAAASLEHAVMTSMLDSIDGVHCAEVSTTSSRAVRGERRAGNAPVGSAASNAARFSALANQKV